MPKGRKRRSRPDEDEDDKEGAQSASAEVPVVDDRMEVDGQADGDSNANESSDDGDEDEPAAESVADRVRRRRVRPADLIACEGDLRAVAASNFKPPLDSVSRSVVVFETVDDVRKGCGHYKVRLLRESPSSLFEWTTVTSSSRSGMVAEDWRTCSVNAEFVGTKKIRITKAENRRVLQW